ncbi:hypothetical protein [Rhodoferax sp.]|uniref:hypothetical protein n=1 Tax=Rhodoferax sp. TaxID=50421 RepID=UPI002613CE6E|nr:hypothetical protein [Rhodoferax sp.]MDD5479032.1 hypothetical protein [Rhodoferax sp.]
MALFDWLKAKPVEAQSSGLPADGLTVPPSPGAPMAQATDHLDDLKFQRQERREHLYAVVRDVMLRSEVLASRYKFKVLSLDVRGRQFLVMMDLLNTDDLDRDRFMDIERQIATTAAQQHDLQVKAVYWRVNQIEESIKSGSHAPHPSLTASRAFAAKPPVRPGFEAISPEEILAFQQAVLAGTQPKPVMSPKPAASATQPATGYEDTQLLEPDDAASPLSKTQFGGL